MDISFRRRPLSEAFSVIRFQRSSNFHSLPVAFTDSIPEKILTRRDKMGFPVPLKEWMSGEATSFVTEIFQNTKSASRDFVNGDAVLKNLGSSGRFSRKTWALMSLELWQQEFHDKAAEFRGLVS
jgi:asparagine synthase (glutamine-hydrolysing)